MLAGTALVARQDDATGALVVGRRASPSQGTSNSALIPPPKPSADSSNTMKRKNPLSVVGSWVALALASFSDAKSAEAALGARGIEERAGGTVSGIVSNSATGNNLEGAQVILHPGGVSALTARDGRFAFSRIAPGDYTLTASYSGLDPKTVSVQIVAGKASDLDIGLSAGIYQLSKFVVSGEREGNALAITQQRNANNIKNVIASDAFGNIADQNIGNLLVRSPGHGGRDPGG